MGIDISETELRRFYNSRIIAELIPQNLQILAQVALANLGRCHTLGENAKWCARRSVYSCSYICGDAGILPLYVQAAIIWWRLEDRKVCETRAESCNARWRGLCGFSPAIP